MYTNERSEKNNKIFREFIEQRYNKRGITKHDA